MPVHTGTDTGLHSYGHFIHYNQIQFQEEEDCAFAQLLERTTDNNRRVNPSIFVLSDMLSRNSSSSHPQNPRDVGFFGGVLVSIDKSYMVYIYIYIYIFNTHTYTPMCLSAHTHTHTHNIKVNNYNVLSVMLSGYFNFSK